MRFGAARRRERHESIVPMINVVFLLLVFLLLTAEIAPAPPVEIRPPEAEVETAAPAGAWILHIAADGTAALGALRGAAALDAVPAGAELELRADAALPAADLAAMLPRLARASRIRLITVAP